MHSNFFSKWKEKITKKSGCKPYKQHLTSNGITVKERGIKIKENDK